MTDFHQGSSNDRNTLLIRFMLIYIICILCAIVPLYYLFNIPGIALQKLKVSEMSVKSQKDKIDHYQLIMTDLDKYLAENKLEKEYRKCVDDLYSIAKDSIDEKNLYKPLFIKITDLYEMIEKINEGGGKAEIDKLKEENEKLATEKKELEKDVKTLEKENLQLMLNK
jgi:hypothetical protein